MENELRQSRWQRCGWRCSLAQRNRRLRALNRRAARHRLHSSLLCPSPPTLAPPCYNRPMPFNKRQLQLVLGSPHTYAYRRVVAVGGMTKRELLDRLRSSSIALNRYAELIFDCDSFTTSTKKSRVSTIELDVQGLGFPQGTDVRGYSRQGVHDWSRLLPVRARGSHQAAVRRSAGRGDWSGGETASDATRCHHNRLGAVERAGRLSEGLLSQANRRRALAAWLLCSNRAHARPR